jgi:hypothetical protein
LKLQSNFWRTHVKNLSDNLLAVKFLTLFGSGTFLNKVQGLRQAGRGPAAERWSATYMSTAKLGNPKLHFA